MDCRRKCSFPVGLLVQSMIRLTTAPLGFKRHGLLMADIPLPTSSYSKAEDWMRFWDRLR